MESIDQHKRQTVHDFLKEWIVLQVITGYQLIKTSKWYLIFDIHYIIGVDLIHIFTGVLAIQTLTNTNLQRTDQVHIYETVILIFFNIVSHNLVLSHLDKLNSAIMSINYGVYKYTRHTYDEELQIKKTRVGQIRFINKTFTRLMFISVFSYLVCIPFLQYKNGKKSVNPLLPLPIQMPFDTYSVVGFIIAYVINAIQIVFFHAKGICYTQLVVSSSLQLSAQIELLNFSLINIEGRALRMMKIRNSEMDQNTADLYEYNEFQDCLYECLRENIQHHHAILRLKQDIDFFMSDAVLLATLLISLLMGSKVIVITQDPGNNTAMIFVLFCEIFGFLQICWVGQIVTNQSEMTTQNLYSTPWYKCNKKFNVLLGMIITNSRIPMRFRSRGGLKGLSFSLEFFSDAVIFAFRVATVLTSV